MDPKLVVKNIDSPDETRPFTDKGKAEVVKLGSLTVGHSTFEPGWRWSKHVKPIAGTESCQTAHVGYVVSGRMHIVMEDGTEQEVGTGDFVAVAPGHDAWVVGDEACHMLEFGGAEGYAKRRAGSKAA